LKDNPDQTNQHNSAWTNSDLLIPKFISKQERIYPISTIIGFKIFHLLKPVHSGY